MGFWDVVYRVYQRNLLAEIRKGRIPQHVGLILDGNRRYARLLGASDVAYGHQRGADIQDGGDVGAARRAVGELTQQE